MRSDKDFTEYAASNVDQIQHAGDPRIQLWRSVWRTACHQYSPRCDLQELPIKELNYTDLLLFEGLVSVGRVALFTLFEGWDFRTPEA